MSKTDGIDRSKRVAYGCTINSDNILSSKRSRKNFSSNSTEQTISKSKKKSFELKNKENLKQMTNKMNKTELKKKKKFVKEEYKTNEDIKENEKIVKELTEDRIIEEKITEDKLFEQKISKENYNTKIEENIEKLNITPTKSPRKILEENYNSKIGENIEKLNNTPTKSPRKSLIELNLIQLKKLEFLSEKNVKYIELFGGIVKTKIDGRSYSLCEYEIPHPILQFLEAGFNENRIFDIDKFNLQGISFCGEFVLTADETKEFKFLTDNKDCLLFGDGDQLLACLQTDRNQNITDFNVYALFDEEKDTFKGPWKLSEILENMVEDKF
jgi:hypothetical protein